MSNVSQYSTSAASNNDAAPDGFPEGMAPSGVNDAARELMAALARFYQDIGGTLVSTGSSNAYVVTSNSSHAALADIGLLVFRANHANTGAATLAVDGLTAKDIVKGASGALDSGDIAANQIVMVRYNATTDDFHLLSASDFGTAAALNTGTASGELPTNGDLGALSLLDTVDTAQIDDEAVTNAKMAHVATSTLKGRATASTGDLEDLTAAQVRSILGVDLALLPTARAKVTNGGSVALAEEAGVDTVTRTGAGIIDVVLDDTMSSANYTIMAMAVNTDAFINITAQSTTGFTIRTDNSGGAATDMDFFFIVIGTKA